MIATSQGDVLTLAALMQQPSASVARRRNTACIAVVRRGRLQRDRKVSRILMRAGEWAQRRAATHTRRLVGEQGWQALVDANCACARKSQIGSRAERLWSGRSADDEGTTTNELPRCALHEGARVLLWCRLFAQSLSRARQNRAAT